MTPPEVVTRCPAGPEVPALPALPAGASVPRATVAQRDRATGAYIAGLAAAHATCRANSEALRRFFRFALAKQSAEGDLRADPRSC